MSTYTTSLAAQLETVSAAAGPKEEKLRGKASLLYEIREAADIDLATIYAVGLQGARRPSPSPPPVRYRRIPPPPPPPPPPLQMTAP